MSIDLGSESILTSMKEMNTYIMQAVNLTKKGYTVKGLGRDGEDLTLVIDSDGKEIDLVNLDINMNS